MQYFSDLEKGVLPQIKNEIPHNVWSGIAAYIDGLIKNGYFAENFPECCHDNGCCYGTNKDLFSSALKAEIPEIEYPFVTKGRPAHPFWSDAPTVTVSPDYLSILDLIQFCYKNISKPSFGDFHQYYQHRHIRSFDKEYAKNEFREYINTVFQRNGLAYELLSDGNIAKVVSDSLNSIITQPQKNIEDELDELLKRANKKISNPDIQVRYDALKELWDAFERIKTIESPDKKNSMNNLLQRCSGNDEAFKSQLDAESRELTKIGNAFFIRHSETSQIKLSDGDHVEYLFHRLASLMQLMIKKI